jgi:hypothetical protein
VLNIKEAENIGLSLLENMSVSNCKCTLKLLNVISEVHEIGFINNTFHAMTL